MTFCLVLSLFVWAINGSLLLKLPFLSIGLGYALTYSGLFLLVLFIPALKYAAFSWSWASLLSGTLVFIHLLRKKETFPLILHSLKLHRAISIYLLIYGFYLFFQGAYLEIPSDGIGVHLFRIGEWLRCGTLPPSEERNALSMSTSYWGYLYSAALVALSPFSRLKSLEFLNILNCLTLTLSIYLATYRFTQQTLLSVLGTFLFQLTCGVHVYAYFRYYTFAPTFLNMILVFDSLNLLSLSIEKKKLSPFLPLIFIFFLITMLCHKQEGLFILIYLMSAGFLLSLKSFNPDTYRRVQKISLALLGLSTLIFIVGVFTGKLTQGLEHSPKEYLHLLDTEGFSLVMGNPDSRLFGSVFSGPFLTLGVICTLLLWRLFKQTGSVALNKPIFLGYFISITIVGLSLFPLSATALSFLFYDAVFYRLSYAVLFALLAPALTLKYFSLCGRHTQVALIGLWLIVGWQTFLGKYPRGLDFFEFSHAADSFHYWVPALEAVRNQVQPNCSPSKRTPEIFTDPITSYPMNYLVGLYTPTCYLWRCDLPGMTWDPPETAEEFNHFFKEFRFFLIHEETDFTHARPRSHWSPDVRNIRSYYTPALMRQIQAWTKSGALVKELEVGKMTLLRRVDNP